METSYAHGNPNIVVILQDLNVMQDGTFKNTRLFAGTYEIWPFETCGYPCTEETQKTIVSNGGKTTKVEFTIIPYLILKWVRELYQDTDNYIKASFKFKRNAKEGVDMPDVYKAKLLILTTMRCVENSDGRYTDNDLTITNDQEGEIVELKLKDKIWFTQKIGVKVGTKCGDTYKKYSFTDIETLEAQGFGCD